MPASRTPLLHRALGVFVLLTLCLALFLWAGRALMPRSVDAVYLDSRRLAALRTFERAIVPVKSLRDYPAPSADLIGKQFDFCVEPLKMQRVSARSRSANPCANASAAEELACHLGTINTRLADMRYERGKNREGLLTERYVVNVERWADGIRTAQNEAAQAERGKHSAVACRDALDAARQLAARDGRLLGLLAWRELSPKTVAAAQFAPDQAVKVPARVLEQRNPWGGIPGCIYYGGESPGGKLMFVTDRRQSNRQAGRHHRPFTRLQRHRLAIGNSRAQVHAGRVSRLIGGQGQPFKMRQRRNANGDGHQASPDSPP